MRCQDVIKIDFLNEVLPTLTLKGSSVKSKRKLWRILYVQPRNLDVLLADEDPVENVKQENDMVRLMF